MTVHDFETHRCRGSLRHHASIRRYLAGDPPYFYRDGRWHLGVREYDVGYMADYMSHVAPIRYCPWCGKELT